MTGTACRAGGDGNFAAACAGEQQRCRGCAGRGAVESVWQLQLTVQLGRNAVLAGLRIRPLVLRMTHALLPRGDSCLQLSGQVPSPEAAGVLGPRPCACVAYSTHTSPPNSLLVPLQISFPPSLTHKPCLCLNTHGQDQLQLVAPLVFTRAQFFSLATTKGQGQYT